jgi:hypothetical protein
MVGRFRTAAKEKDQRRCFLHIPALILLSAKFIADLAAEAPAQIPPALPAASQDRFAIRIVFRSAVKT